MSKELDALEIISTISLSHLECGRDEGLDGEWEYTEYEKYDGTIREIFPQEINIIKSALEILEIIKKWSFIQDNYKKGYGTFTQFLCNIHTIGMKQDFERVKEWLNEKT